MTSITLSPDLLDGLAKLGLTPSPAQLEQLRLYKEHLLDWNRRINLVAESTLPIMDIRHLLDSAQLALYIVDNKKEILDVGSGAGLPGLILAVLLPSHRFTLAEKVGKKAGFLRSAADAMGLSNVVVHAARAELLPPRAFDVITSRAYAGLSSIIASTSPLLRKNGMWLLLKGESFDAELEACPAARKMTIERQKSITSPTGVIVRLAPNA